MIYRDSIFGIFEKEKEFNFGFRQSLYRNKKESGHSLLVIAKYPRDGIEVVVGLNYGRAKDIVVFE